MLGQSSIEVRLASVSSGAELIGCRQFRSIDNEYLHRKTPAFEAKAELFLQRGEYRNRLRSRCRRRLG